MPQNRICFKFLEKGAHVGGTGILNITYLLSRQGWAFTSLEQRIEASLVFHKKKIIHTNLLGNYITKTSRHKKDYTIKRVTTVINI